MNVKSVIIEQLGIDGSLKSVQLDTNKHGALVIAFADEYDGERNASFYFQDPTHDIEVQKQFNERQARFLGSKLFKENNGVFWGKIAYRAIPTTWNELTYYSLILPEYAIPIEVFLLNPHSGKQMRKSVIKDVQKNRYIIYVECRSNFGVFNFDLECSFVVNEDVFGSAEYDDDFNLDPYANYDQWEYFVSKSDKILIQNYFGEVNMGDTYNVQQAGVVGKSAIGRNIEIKQVNSSTDNSEVGVLLEQLNILKCELGKHSSCTEFIDESRKIAKAERAAKEGDLNKSKEILREVGKWTYDIATKLGISIVVELMKNGLGWTK